MPLYVIKNTDTGKYVAAPGSEHSYTTRLGEARTFSTYAAGAREACENERVLSVETLLRCPEA